MFKVKNLFHNYKIYKDEKAEPEERSVLRDLSFEIKKGQFVGILGRNGSGKSTLAFHLAALLKPSSGTVLVAGKDTSKAENLLMIRKISGMVFQNPDNQLIGSTVEEDLAFGLENLGRSPEEMDRTIDSVLASMGLPYVRDTEPHRLSGGQKQKVAVSGVLAMEPECIIFDEPTAMADPAGRSEIARVIRRLNKDKGITILYVTHDATEVEDADYLFIMDEGQIAIQGTPADVFRHHETLLRCGVAVLPRVELEYRLRKKGVELTEDIEDEDDLIRLIRDKLQGHCGGMQPRDEIQNCDELQGRDGMQESDENQEQEYLLELTDVNYHYPGSLPEQFGLSHISFKVSAGECIAVIGPVGSGKSTLFLHLNGLISPETGMIRFHGEDISAEGYPGMNLRKKVALCFQNPESQLFADTVLEDVIFAPLNMGADRETAEEQGRRAMRLMGLGKEYEDLSPFLLSGGEQRRAALAGILTMEPEILVLDEPASGLDEAGRRRLYDLIKRLQRECNMTIIFSTHSMEAAAEIASRVIVLQSGQIAADGRPEEVFHRSADLVKIGLDVPWAQKFIRKLTENQEKASEDRPTGSPDESAIPQVVSMDSLEAWILERVGEA